MSRVLARSRATRVVWWSRSSARVFVLVGNLQMVGGPKESPRHPRAHAADADKTNRRRRLKKRWWKSNPRLFEDFLGDAEAFYPRRNSAIDHRAQQHFLDVRLSQTVVERAADMRLQFIGAVERRQHGEIGSSWNSPFVSIEVLEDQFDFHVITRVHRKFQGRTRRPRRRLRPYSLRPSTESASGRAQQRSREPEPGQA